MLYIGLLNDRDGRISRGKVLPPSGVLILLLLKLLLWLLLWLLLQIVLLRRVLQLVLWRRMCCCCYCGEQHSVGELKYCGW